MSDVEFQDEAAMPQTSSLAQRSPKGLSQFLIAHKWAKDEKAANQILLGVALVAFVLAASVFLLSGDGNAPPLTEAEKLQNELSTSGASR